MLEKKKTLFTVSVENILFKENKVVLSPNKTEKYSNLNTLLNLLMYHWYQEKSKLCIVNCLKI